MSGNFRFGRHELRPDERALLFDGKALRLGGRAFDILLALVERRDRVVEFDELLDVVWPGLAVEENNLSVQVSSLRKLLGAEAITTVRGKGYRFTAATQQVEGAGARQAPPADVLKRGAVVIVELAGAGSFDDLLTSPVLGAKGACVVARSNDSLCIAFERTRDVVGAAKGALRPVASAWRIGIAAAGRLPPDADDPPDPWQVARGLASRAAPGEIVVTADIAAEFVDGVDADVEDIGDQPLAGGAVRAYRIHAPAQAGAAAGALAFEATELRPGIAVLPFECLMDDAPDDILGDALADDVIAHLSRSTEFSVISSLSSRRLRRCGMSPPQAAGCLAAAFILTGSYRRVPGGVSLNAVLQDLRRGTVLRSMHIETSLQAAFDAAHSVGHRLSQEIAHAVFDRAVQQAKFKPLAEMESYSLLLGAIALMHRAAVHEFERARAMLEYLHERPGCAGVASAWLAKWHVLRAVQGWSLDAAADARSALDHVSCSLEADSRDALALSIGGLVHAYLRKDLQAAGRLYEQAIDANPSEPLAWLFSATRHAYLGHGPQAEDAGERALRLSPIDPMKYFFDSLAATAALANSRWERSVALSERSLRANRTHASTWRTLAFALVMLDRMDEARAAVQRLLAIEPGFTVGRFEERFPGRDGPLAAPWAEALKVAGLPA